MYFPDEEEMLEDSIEQDFMNGLWMENYDRLEFYLYPDHTRDMDWIE